MHAFNLQLQDYVVTNVFPHSRVVDNHFTGYGTHQYRAQKMMMCVSKLLRRKEVRKRYTIFSQASF